MLVAGLGFRVGPLSAFELRGFRMELGASHKRFTGALHRKHSAFWNPSWPRSLQATTWQETRVGTTMQTNQVSLTAETIRKATAYGSHHAQDHNLGCRGPSPKESNRLVIRIQ